MVAFVNHSVSWIQQSMLSIHLIWGWVKTLVPSEPQNSWDLWMFIPLKMYRYWPIPIFFWQDCLPSSKRLHNYGKSPFLMGRTSHIFPLFGQKNQTGGISTSFWENLPSLLPRIFTKSLPGSMFSKRIGIDGWKIEPHAKICFDMMFWWVFRIGWAKTIGIIGIQIEFSLLESTQQACDGQRNQGFF